jgi:putative tryptophan/tyrosine transport system substrate-binding protein
MNLKSLFWLLITVLLITAPSTEAQQPKKIPRIGFLATVSPYTISAHVEAFRQGMQRETLTDCPRLRPSSCVSK